MGRFNLDDYEPVEKRIQRFYADHEDGSITTELLNENVNDFAAVKATVLVAGEIRATGLAIEMRDLELTKTQSGKMFESVNYSSWLENAETSAIGRALANFNYTGSKNRPSREEMQKVQRVTQKREDPKITAMYDAVIAYLGDKRMDGALPDEDYPEAVDWVKKHSDSEDNLSIAMALLADKYGEYVDESEQLEVF